MGKSKRQSVKTQTTTFGRLRGVVHKDTDYNV